MKKIIICLCACMLIFSGCSTTKKKEDVKIGVSFGVGAAARWPQEKQYMEEHAKALGVQLEARLNVADEPLTQSEDCKELVDSGIDVLILIARDANNTKEIIDYAHSKNVKVISYARAVMGQPVDLFVGYDSNKIGQIMGQYLSELQYEGTDYIILRGDENDTNATLLYEGAMRFIDPIKKNINILLDESVPGWSPDTAKELVLEAIIKNNHKIDAILAPNDKIAGVCAEVIQELGIENHVVITGMDSELEAVKRIVAGTQDMTVYLALNEMAEAAVDAAVAMALSEEVNINATFDNGSDKPIDSHLISGKLVIKQNIDSVLVDSGFLTKEEIYEK